MISDETITGFRFGAAYGATMAGPISPCSARRRRGTPAALAGTGPRWRDSLGRGRPARALNGNPLCLAAANGVSTRCRPGPDFPAATQALGRRLWRSRGSRARARAAAAGSRLISRDAEARGGRGACWISRLRAATRRAALGTPCAAARSGGCARSSAASGRYTTPRPTSTKRCGADGVWAARGHVAGVGVRGRV